MSPAVEFDVRVFQDVTADAPSDVEPPEVAVSSVELDGGVLWVPARGPEPPGSEEPTS